MMESFCLFRETVGSPIFKSRINLEEGTIQNIPIEYFHCHVPEEFWKKYDNSSDILYPNPLEYYYMSMYSSSALVTFNFYDVGVCNISKNGYSVMLFESCSTKQYDGFSVEKSNLFNYPKQIKGMYKIVVRQFDIPQDAEALYVNENGTFFTDEGIIEFSKFNDYKTLDNFLPPDVKNMRNGFDGTVYSKDGTPHPFKIQDHKVVVF